MTQDFNVSSEIYSLEKLQESIRAFADVSEIIFKQEVLTVSGESNEDIQEIFNEFMNYVLSL